MSEPPVWTPRAGFAARHEAALRMLPLADGRHDPDLEYVRRCADCGTVKDDLARINGRWVCWDRLDCFRAAK